MHSRRAGTSADLSTSSIGDRNLINTGGVAALPCRSRVQAEEFAKRVAEGKTYLRDDRTQLSQLLATRFPAARCHSAHVLGKNNSDPAPLSIFFIFIFHL